MPGTDGVAVGIGTAPADGFATEGHLPDHDLLFGVLGTPHASESVGVVDVGSPVATVRIEVAPC